MTKEELIERLRAFVRLGARSLLTLASQPGQSRGQSRG